MHSIHSQCHLDAVECCNQVFHFASATSTPSGRAGRAAASAPPEVRATLSEPFGKTHVEPLGDAAYALIPTENYQSSQIYRVDADDGQPLFSTRGWATRLFRLR